MNRFKIIRLNKGFLGRCHLKLLDWRDRFRSFLPKKKSPESLIEMAIRFAQKDANTNARDHAPPYMGIMGVGSDGTLYRPNGRKLIRLPMSLAGRIQRFQHRISSVYNHLVVAIHAEEIWKTARDVSLFLLVLSILTIVGIFWSHIVLSWFFVVSMGLIYLFCCWRIRKLEQSEHVRHLLADAYQAIAPTLGDSVRARLEAFLDNTTH